MFKRRRETMWKGGLTAELSASDQPWPCGAIEAVESGMRDKCQQMMYSKSAICGRATRRYQRGGRSCAWIAHIVFLLIVARQQTAAVKPSAFWNDGDTDRFLRHRVQGRSDQGAVTRSEEFTKHGQHLRGENRDDVAAVVEADSSTGKRSLVLPRPVIVGGFDTTRGRYPYVAYLESCAGSLIAPNLVLTAGHCMNRFNVVRLGVHDRVNDITSANAAVETFIVEEVVRHEFYSRVDRAAGADLDFAVVKFFGVSQYAPVHLQKEDNMTPTDDVDSDGVDDVVVTAVGWGLTETGNVPNFLQEVDLKYIPNAECRNSTGCDRRTEGTDVDDDVASDVEPTDPKSLSVLTEEQCEGAGTWLNYSGLVTDAMMCANGGANSGRDSCKGDSGAPLILKPSAGDPSQDIQAGIVSWGPFECGHPNLPGVYSRISDQFEWIRGKVCLLAPKTAPEDFMCTLHNSDGRDGIPVAPEDPIVGDVVDTEDAVLTVRLQLDHQPQETGWLVESLSDGTIYRYEPPGTYREFELFDIKRTTVKLKSDDLYRFVMLDLNGDGLYDGSFYQVFLSMSEGSQSRLVVSSTDSGGFVNGYSKEHVFRATAMPETTSPTSEPSSVPTSSPVSFPSTSLVANPTSSPTALPTFPFDDKEPYVAINITFDFFPNEMAWALMTVPQNETFASRPFRSYSPARANKNFVEKINLLRPPASDSSGIATQKYKFTVEDKFGDGICCESGTGSYSVSFGHDNSERILLWKGSPDFRSHEEFVFTVSWLADERKDTLTPTLSPTSSPSTSPSTAPKVARVAPEHCRERLQNSFEYKKGETRTCKWLRRRKDDRIHKICVTKSHKFDAYMTCPKTCRTSPCPS